MKKDILELALHIDKSSKAESVAKHGAKSAQERTDTKKLSDRHKLSRGLRILLYIHKRAEILTAFHVSKLVVWYIL